MVLGIGGVVDANLVVAAPEMHLDHLQVGVSDAARLRTAADQQVRPHAEADDATMAVAAGNAELAVGGGIAARSLRAAQRQRADVAGLADVGDEPRSAEARTNRDLDG